MIRPLRVVLSITIFLVLCACAERYERESGLLDVFPQATEVRIYSGERGIRVDKDGGVTTQAPAADGNDSFVTKPATSGGRLTEDEVTILRSSIFAGPPPDPLVFATCCIPRHAFLFYSATGKYLGFIKVCFQCGCIEIHPDPRANPGKSWITWNEKQLSQIIEAHGLHVKAPWQ